MSDPSFNYPISKPTFLWTKKNAILNYQNKMERPTNTNSANTETRHLSLFKEENIFKTGSTAFSG